MAYQYRQVERGYDREFARNRALHGSRIRCGPGCDDCCHQLFQITELEAARISECVAGMEGDRREALQRRARAYLVKREELMGSGAGAESWGALAPPGSRLACPALEDGVCGIYEHRPLMCRKFGIPLWNPDRPGRVYACQLNFRDGEEIEDGELIQIQTGLHKAWKEVQATYNRAGGRRDSSPATVARAIVEDFRG